MTDKVDLNCDMGESFGAYRIGADEAVFPFITSANVACGYHGGDPSVMRSTIARARQRGVAVGAHPGLPDLIGFGRRAMDVTPEDAYDMVVYQVGALLGFANAAKVELQHVKAHGALYNMAAVKQDLAAAIARAVRDVDPGLVLFGLPGSHLISEAESVGLTTACEAFADRNYMNDGSLVSRRRPDAQIHDADEAVTRAIRMVREGKIRSVDGEEISIRADTICIHGDGPHAVEFAEKIREGFEEAGIAVRAVGRGK
ncbi:MAG: lactam utilization protein LamB [Gemmatimonadetes bacterium]|nr:lactam utilization protein LamB [Gemmatimonadota bacterium]